ncbi:MAG: GNAT family N-acetyltransferase [Parachlamydiaceae bacterium]
MPQPRKITLRTFNSADIADFMEWATDDEVTQYLMWNSYLSLIEVESFFNTVIEKHAWFKAICLGNKAIGSITLDKSQGAYSCKAELGYVIAKKYWGNGFATQAIALAIGTGFQDLDIARIEAYVDPSNIASQRALEKNHFLREGCLKKYLLQKGQLKDRYIYATFKP